MSKGLRLLFGRGLFVFLSGYVVIPFLGAIRLRPFCVCRFEENHISMTDNRIHIKNGIRRLYHQASKLNLYVQNAKVLDDTRIATELKQITIQLNELSNQRQNKGEALSEEE